MPHLQGLLAVVALVGAWLPSVGNPVDLLTVASVVAVSVVLLLIWQPSDQSVPLIRVRARVLRERAHRAAFLRTRDPDADGRVRPRAPGQCRAAV